MATKTGSRLVIYAALAGNLLIALTKFGAAAFTGSAAMLSEGVHSLVDTGNQGLLLYGMHRAAKPADRKHPLGHGRELYFWSFIVALLVFALGAGVSIYQGIHHLAEPEPIQNPRVNYVVLGLSLLFEGSSWFLALREFRGLKGRRGYIEAVRRSKDPTTFTVLFEDSAALVGLLIALAGVAGAQLTGLAWLDGAASIGIGLVLAVTAVFLARETKALLIGEAAYPETVASILRIAADDPDIASANGVVSTQLGPQQIVIALSAEFEDGLDAPAIERAVLRVEQAMRAAHPEIVALFVKPQTAATWRRARAALDGEA
ncbi:cation diffusion facilitator family transporter [Coralloluteibacterium stylophorae]|uniref:Cation transporter n=1 Tax=Coralloluteibacterium stylophorae TaxID=1776034 RepID=A0A8J7VXD2_9GAMM|nr:cation diffusion facilitator family transporter [Coralloluteibacterium stylophorae]MBS7458422.1 cation transporter [Coralloluteibacterium stylophorae]